MELIDGCYGAIIDLAESIRDNCQTKEHHNDISRMIDAMYSLAAIAVELELVHRGLSIDPVLMVSRVVFTTLLNDAVDYDAIDTEAFCNMLIDLANTNSRFANSLRTISSWIETEEGQLIYADECKKYGLVSSLLQAADRSEHRL